VVSKTADQQQGKQCCSRCKKRGKGAFSVRHVETVCSRNRVG